MLSLNLAKPEPKWVDFGGRIPGLEILCAPITSAVVAEARHVARGAASDAMDAGHDVSQVEGGSDAAYLTAVAKRVILDWKGVVGPGDEPLPVTAEAVDALMSVAPIADLFAVMVLGPHQWLSAEKNVSLPGQNGSGAAGGNTAANAQPLDTPAPEGAVA